MSWLSSTLDRVLPPRADALVLSSVDAWMLGGGVDQVRGRDLIRFLNCAIDVFPAGSILYLEGAVMSPAVESLLATRQLNDTCLMPRASTWIRTRKFHVPFRKQLINDLAGLVAHQPTEAMCDHLHIYREGNILLQGFDAGWEPMLVSFSLAESTIASLCRRTGMKYERSFQI